MAGKYIEIINPGYSTLYTRDLKYAANTSRDAADPSNPFNPDAANPIIEGEWLSMTSGNKVTRAGDATAGATDLNVATAPALLHFAERGRYDAQLSKKAHCITGPSGFEFTCKLGDFTGAAAGERVLVADFENPSAAGKYVKALYGLGAYLTASTFSGVVETQNDAAGAMTGTHQYWSPGWIMRVVSSSEAVIKFEPQLIAVDAT
jgi:hypothetical protein